VVEAGGDGSLLLMHPERPTMMNSNPNNEIRIRYPPAMPVQSMPLAAVSAILS
jgi:hypothetical protein